MRFISNVPIGRECGAGAPARETVCSADTLGREIALGQSSIANGPQSSSQECRPFAGEGARVTLNRRLLHALILTAAVFLFIGAGPGDDARFKDLGHRMMCTCGCGQVLLECNHVGCQSSDKMRDQLLAALDKGNNDDLILQGFVQEYGPTVIAAPTATGFNRVAWIMPFFVLALGIAFAIQIVRSWKNRPTPALADGIVIPQGNELDRLRAQARKETDL